mmetsp:Transcript_57721/g.148487  ORF Transcript_57721/g.148487 Transcript_57721/m.148487 type:complete len:227 (-) Transcript_57721:302-982(-)
MSRCRGVAAALLVACAAFGTCAFVGLGAQPLMRGPPRSSVLAAAAQGQPQAAEAEELISWTRYTGAAFSMMAALVVVFAPISEAQAARSGGRIGGSAPSKRAAPPSSSKTINRTTIINKTTVVAPPPPPVIVAPPVVMAPSYGMGGVGMMGMPVVVAPPPTLGEVVVGAAISGAINGSVMNSMANNRGPSTTDRIMENQMRQDERQMDRQASQIDDLQRQIAEMKK